MRQADQEGSANRSMRDNRRRSGRNFREEMDSSNDVIPHRAHDPRQWRQNEDEEVELEMALIAS